MIRLSPLAKLAAIALLTLGTLALSACSPNSTPNPNAKQVLSACLAVTNVDAGKLFGTELTAFKLSGEGSPTKVCKYIDAKGTAYALLKLQSADKIKDPAADLNADAEQNKMLFKNNLKPIVIHPADGFGPGAFYVNNTAGPDATSVQLHVIENGYKILAQVNNPKDFPSGEKQAAAMVKQAFTNIQNGAALQTL
ncbi:MAG TPA: hypothetical protein VFX47_06655 [Gammaproteobacteria bacterium]|nr:hypothetical protein [Gammaproteobacteria bacterium]